MIKKFLIASFFLFGVFFFVNQASAYNYNCECNDLTKFTVADCALCNSECAKNTPPSTQKSCELAANQTGVLEEITIVGQSPIRLANPLNVDSPQQLIGKVINSILGIVGSIALLMFVFGGLTWMTSSGNPEKVKKGRDIIVWSAIGLAIIFLSYALTRFVLSTITQ